jgi:predicted kinase
VTLLSGLPGAGKDTWIDSQRQRERLPVVSLDALGEELDVAASDTGPQGAVVMEARERARVHLRAGESFVWNATNLSRKARAQVIDLAAAYQARVGIVAVEAPAKELWSRNRCRDNGVPEEALRRMLDRWEMPDLTEAHTVMRAP